MNYIGNCGHLLHKGPNPLPSLVTREVVAEIVYDQAFELNFLKTGSIE